MNCECKACREVDDPAAQNKNLQLVGADESDSDTDTDEDSDVYDDEHEYESLTNIIHMIHDDDNIITVGAFIEFALQEFPYMTISNFLISHKIS